MEDQRSTFTYTPLSQAKREIRLLHLLPKHRSGADSPISRSGYSDDIRCIFSHASLDSPPPFTALSYVWGDPKGVIPIYLDGHEFHVTTNLHCALSHLQLDHEERVLWVDALCINQAAKNERTSQVSLMQYIYGSASEVVVFLGEFWEGCYAAMDFMEDIAADPNLHYDPGLHPHAETHDMDISSEVLRSYLIKFFSSPWFSRTWTVQEYVLARKVIVQCGQRWLNGVDLHTFRDNLSHHEARCCSGSSYLGIVCSGEVSVWYAMVSFNSLKDFRENRDALDFLQVAVALTDRECYDPRDKIYGILGLVGRGIREFVRPDYNISTTRLYVNVAMASIRQTRNLDILSSAHGKGSLPLNLPSYVPDWTASLSGQWMAHFRVRCAILTLGIYNACGGSAAELKLAPNIAAGRAVIVDTISEADSSRFVNWKGLVENWRELARVDHHTQFPYAAKTTAYWKTLCGGSIVYLRGSRQNMRRVDEADFSKYKQWQEWMDLSQPESRRNENIASFDKAFRAAVVRRTFIVTKKGHIGLGPTSCRAGDLVVLMPGGKVPYILRPAPKEDEMARTSIRSAPTECIETRRFTFLGDAYVHGIMNGEAFDEKRLEPIVFI